MHYVSCQQVFNYSLLLLIQFKTMIKLNQLVIVLMTLAMVISQSEECSEPNYVIPFSPIDDIFSSGFDSVRAQQNLVTLIEDPTSDNVRNYILSLAPYFAPLLAFGCLSFVLMIAMIVQLICFNACGSECCGNEIDSSTYNVCCMRVMTITFIILSFILVCLSIGAIIINSDLQQAVDYTSCNTQNIVTQTFNGNTNETIPWSGINNFGDDISLFSINIQNIVPNLQIYFSDQNTAYTEVVAINSATTPYNKSQTYNCQNASGFTITCPFADSNTCPSPYEAQFTLNFCDPDVTNSAQNLISNEMEVNSTNWRDNIVGMGQTLSSTQINQANIDTLTTDINQFTGSVGDYEQNIQNGFSQSETVTYGIQIALYVMYSLLLVMGIFGITTVCCTYYCNNFKCNCFTYLWCGLYCILAVVLFIFSAFNIAGSFGTFDVCSAYPYYFQNQTNFNSLTFSSDQIGDIFKTCFFQNSTSMFTAFEDSTVLTDFTQLKSQYELATPSSSFSTVVTTIEGTVFNYNLNPSTITISNVNSNQQPSVALSEANTFANFSATNSTQSCNVTKDLLVYNVAKCYPYLTDQAPGQNACVVLSSAQNISSVITNRSDAFDNKNCSDNGTIYVDNANALFNYRTSINSIANDLVSVTDDPTNPLQEYEDNYFSYYSNVLNFFNDQVTAMLTAIFTPYDSLYEGSSCGFITTSMNGIVSIGCNQLFPYFNTLSILNIIISVILFILMILTYFLTTRYQFYEYLDGDFENYGKDKKDYAEADSSRNYNQELITANTGRY